MVVLTNLLLVNITKYYWLKRPLKIGSLRCIQTTNFFFGHFNQSVFTVCNLNLTYPPFKLNGFRTTGPRPFNKRQVKMRMWNTAGS